jgi:predicted RNA-binding Zn ribbon-like protein
MTEHVFDLDGGSLPLDFANTLSLHTGEHLHSYEDLVSFARQTGIVEAVPKAGPDEARRVHQLAVALRTALSELFGAIADGVEPPSEALTALNLHLAEAMGHARIERAGSGCVWGWESSAAPDRLLWPIVRAAADLLADREQLSRVRQCGARDCAWLFLDTSKNRSRQWCDMKTCGNREKARRYLARRRGVTP